MKIFISTLAKFSIAFLLLIGIQFFFFDYLFSSKIDLKINKELNVLVLGNSNLETNLNDSIVKNSINLCQGADATYFSYIKLKKICKENTQIKKVILGFNPENVFSTIFYDLPVMKARYGNYFYLMDYEDYPDLLRYNTEAFIRAIAGFGKNFIKIPSLLKSHSITNLGLGGFLPRPAGRNELKPSIEKFNEKEIALSPNSLELKYFQKIVKYCSQNNIQLIVINPPVHQSVLQKRKLEKVVYSSIVEKDSKSFTFWDCETFKLEDKYYYDYSHLNKKGANIFSKHINQKLEGLN